MKALLALVKAWASWLWSWVVWVKAKGWAGLKGVLNYTYDPPPHHVKYWMVVVLGIAVGGAWFGAEVRGWFDHTMLGQAMAPVRHVSSAPDTLLDSVAVFPSQMPAKLDAPKPTDLAPLKPIVVVPPIVPAQPAHRVRAYRVKPKAREASSPFPG